VLFDPSVDKLCLNVDVMDPKKIATLSFNIPTTNPVLGLFGNLLSLFPN